MLSDCNMLGLVLAYVVPSALQHGGKGLAPSDALTHPSKVWLWVVEASRPIHWQSGVSSEDHIMGCQSCGTVGCVICLDECR